VTTRCHSGGVGDSAIVRNPTIGQGGREFVRIEFIAQWPRDRPPHARVGAGCITMTQPKQKGFTLVEIAVVLVIIGLLLGAILQGQQLIASARVSNLSDQQAGIQAAYFGFIDRYRAVPGDMERDEARDAIGDPDIVLGNATGASNGRLSDPGDGEWQELNGVWEHLSKSGFIRGSYGRPAAADNPPTSEDAPTNAFNGVVILARHNGYQDSRGTDAPERLLFNFGENVPASIARELDVKLDDGRPATGSVRNSVDGDAVWQSNDTCVEDGENTWDIEFDEQNCNPVFIF